MGRLNVDKSVDFFLVAPPASKPSDGRLTAACQQLNAQRLAHPFRHFNISVLTFGVFDCTNTDMRILPGLADKNRLAAAHREMRELRMQYPGKDYYVCSRTFEIIEYRSNFRSGPVWEVVIDCLSNVVDPFMHKALLAEILPPLLAKIPLPEIPPPPAKIPLPEMPPPPAKIPLSKILPLRLETILLRYVLPAAKLVPLPVESAACMKRKNLLALIYPLN